MFCCLAGTSGNIGVLKTSIYDPEPFRVKNRDATTVDVEAVDLNLRKRMYEIWWLLIQLSVQSEILLCFERLVSHHSISES